MTIAVVAPLEDRCRKTNSLVFVYSCGSLRSCGIPAVAFQLWHSSCGIPAVAFQLWHSVQLGLCVLQVSV